MKNTVRSLKICLQKQSQVQKAVYAKGRVETKSYYTPMYIDPKS